MNVKILVSLLTIGAGFLLLSRNAQADINFNYMDTYKKFNNVISPNGVDGIKAEEELRLKRYDDGRGGMTIGWGHFILLDESFVEPISISEAESLLLSDLNFAEKAVNKYVTVPLSQNQYDALVSFVFNVGVTAFKDSTLLRLINNNDFENAANEFKRWKYSKGKVMVGLINRRRRERNLFVSV